MTDPLLAELRASGVALRGGDRLRYRLSRAITPPVESLLRDKSSVLAALHNEMAETIDGWPSAYRRWWWQTVLYARTQGLSEAESAWRAYEDIAAQLEEHRQERRPELLAFLEDDPMRGAHP